MCCQNPFLFVYFFIKYQVLFCVACVCVGMYVSLLSYSVLQVCCVVTLVLGESCVLLCVLLLNCVASPKLCCKKNVSHASRIK